nr:hypothetical protein [Lignipirellula cremea]
MNYDFLSNLGRPPRSIGEDFICSPTNFRQRRRRSQKNDQGTGGTSRCIALVVLQQSAQPLLALDFAGKLTDFISGLDPFIFQSLMVSLAVVVLKERRNSAAQRAFTEEDHARERFGFEAPHERLDESVQIGAARGQQQRSGVFPFQDVAEGPTELRVAVHEQVTLAQ